MLTTVDYMNGYLLPEHYQIEDLAEFVDSAINN